MDDPGVKRAAARTRPQVRYGRPGNPRHVIWAALAASVIWVAAVLAFAWGRYGLPSDPGSAVEAAQSRLGFADWLIILAVIIGPLLLIWVIAWLVRRSMELRDESRKLARAAVLLADAAEIAEKRIAELQPAAAKDGERVAAEIERTNDAIGALRRQFAAMQKTLVRQSASLGATVNTSKLGVAGAAGGAVGLLASDVRVGETKTPPTGNIADAPPTVTRAAPPVPERPVLERQQPVKPPLETAKPAVPVAKPVSELRAELQSASKASPWRKLVSDEQIALEERPSTLSMILGRHRRNRRQPLPRSAVVRPLGLRPIGAMRMRLRCLASIRRPSTMRFRLCPVPIRSCPRRRILRSWRASWIGKSSSGPRTFPRARTTRRPSTPFTMF
jgi:hypothetical protein